MAHEHPSGLPYAYDRARNRSDVKSVVFYGDRPIIQAAELNDLQSVARNGRQRIGDLIAKNGDRVRGAFAVVERDLARVTLTAGEIYIGGDVLPVEEATLTDVSLDGTVSIGVRLRTTYVTHEDDESLVGLAPGSDAEGEPGAAREIVSIVWARADEDEAGDYHQVYLLQDGTILDQTPPPALEGVMQGLALYDRPHGHYIVSGCRVTALGANEDGAQVFSIEEGEFNVNGFKTVRHAALRHIEDEVWDTMLVAGETHIYGEGASHTINVFNAPIDEIGAILLTKEKTVSITRGAVAHGADALPDTGVIAIVQVKQGETTFVASTDYTRVGNTVDWAPLGAEPAGSSTYNVTYRYRSSVTADEFSPSSITVSGGAEGGEVIITYTYKLPRVDRLCHSQDGRAHYVRGVSARTNPMAPIAPANLLPLCKIHNDWIGKPRVENDGNYMPTVAEQMKMWRTIEDHSRLIMLERGRREIDAKEPTGVRGMFVDPLVDDTFRDAGEAQSAAVYDGMIQLPIEVTVHSVVLSGPVWLDFEEELIVDQPLRTGCEKINPYANFNPLPGAMSLTPAADFWTVSLTEWTSPVTQSFNRGVAANGGPLETVSVANQRVAQRSEQLEFLRSISVSFTIKGFGNGENLTELLFDGIDVTPDTMLSADEDGVVTGSFVIPENVPAGTKVVRASGQGGTKATASFTGQGTIVIDVMRRVTTIEQWEPAWVWGNQSDQSAEADPQAQIFRTPELRQLVGVDIHLCKVGDQDHDILVHQVDVENGWPTAIPRAEAYIDMGSAEAGWIEARYAVPTTTPSDRDHAFVVKTDDNEHSISLAALGAFDAVSQRWVTAHPYPVGPRLSSVNARTWTPHQAEALTYRLIAAHYPVTTKTVDLGTVELEDCSDMCIAAAVELPSAGCSIVFEIERPNGTVYRLLPYQVLQLTEYLTEEVAVRAVLTGTNKLSPILYAPVELLAGKIAEEFTYVSRAFAFGNPADVAVYYRAFLPGGATLTGEYDLTDDDWKDIPLDTTEPLAFPQWVERRHEISDVVAVQGRIKLTGTGGPAARLVVGDLGAAIKD